LRYIAPTISPKMQVSAIIQGKNFPKGFQSKSKFQFPPRAPNIAATPRPTVGFFRVGLTLGSS